MDAAKAKVDLLPESVTVARRAGEEGRLFGSVSAIDIAELLQNAELAIQRSEIDMPKGSIKELGEHEIQIILHPQVRQSLKVVVTAEQVEDGEGIQEEIVS
jgi:large subunit ribosomal protein L9